MYYSHLLPILLTSILWCKLPSSLCYGTVVECMMQYEDEHMTRIMDQHAFDTTLGMVRFQCHVNSGKCWKLCYYYITIIIFLYYLYQKILH